MKTVDGEQPAGRLKRSTLLYFGLPDYAVYLAAIPVSLYLPFVYSRDLGLELTDIGLILMLATFVVNVESGIQAILAGFTVVPMILYGSAVFVIWRYPLSAERLASLRNAFARRHARRARTLAQSELRG